MRQFVRRLIAAPPADQLGFARARYHVGAVEAALSALATLILLVVFLWNKSDRTGLLTWAAIAFAVLPGGVIFKHWPKDHNLWWQRAWLNELLFAIGWGLLPILAMPEDPAWQFMVGGAHALLILGGSVQNSQVRLLHLMYVVPYAALTIVGFILNGNETADVVPWIIAVTFAFSTSLAAKQREMHGQLIESMANNERLVADLEDSQARLLASNQELAAAARTDPLTHLANRLGLDEALEARIEDGTGEFSVAFLDLDNFKEVNDTMGHRIGDLLLQAVASRMKSVEQPGEFVARLGGDEFVVLTQPGADPAEVGKRFAAVFADPFAFDGQSLTIRASVGVAKANDASSSDELLRRADGAQYTAKHRGGGGVVVDGDTSLAATDLSSPGTSWTSPGVGAGS